MIWAKEETLPRAEIEAIQLKRLKETVTYIYERVEPYRKKMDEAKVKPEDIQTLQDLRKLPFTYKADFRENYPDGLFAVDKEDIVRYHASSGTTGISTVIGIFLITKPIEWTLNNFPHQTYCMIIGFVLGSTSEIFKDKIIPALPVEANMSWWISSALISIVTFVLGYYAINSLSHFSND